MAQPEQDAGIGTLVSRLIEDGRAYVKAETDYWRALVAEGIVEAKMGIVFILVAVLLAFALLIVLLMGLELALAQLIGHLLATLVVVIAVGAIAGVLVMVAIGRFKRLARTLSGKP